MKYKVAVLRGGPSSEYEISLKTGKSVIENLRNRHQVLDVVIDMHGDWYHNGILVSPAQVLSDVDVVFNAMHGEYGEDGKVQQILEQINVPFTGPKAFSAVQAIRKDHARKIFDDFTNRDNRAIVFQNNKFSFIQGELYSLRRAIVGEFYQDLIVCGQGWNNSLAILGSEALYKSVPYSIVKACLRLI